MDMKKAHKQYEEILFHINEINRIGNSTLIREMVKVQFDCTDCRNAGKNFPVTCNQCYKIANFLQ